MDSGDLLTFEAVARAGGITPAARDLHTVQSNVTARVRRLEGELGVRLFDRHRRGVVLTSAGRALLPYAERVRVLLAEARRAAAGGDDRPRGPLHIGALETTAALRLTPILEAYSRAYPDVELAVQTGTTDGLVEDVRARRLEGALVDGPVAHAELTAVPVVDEELVLVTAPGVADLGAALGTAGPGGPGAGGRAPRDGVPAGVQALVFRAGCSYRRRLEAVLAARGVTRVRWLEFGTLEGIIGCVGAGVGLTLLPRAVVAPAQRSGRVAVHGLRPGEARVTTVFVRRTDAFVSTALDRFMAACIGSGAGRDGAPHPEAVRAG